MKGQILIFLLFSLTFIRCQDSTVYLYLFDSSNSTTNGADGESQFFDYPSGLNQQIPLVVSPNKSFDLFEQIKPYFKNFSLNPNSSEDIVVRTARTYWRNSGYLPYDLVLSEMALANADHKHTPDMNVTQLSVMYFEYGMPIVGQAYNIKHHVTEFCVEVSEKDFRHFIIDRGYNGIYPNIWNTRVRLIYTGKSKNCDLNDLAWADKRAGYWNDSGATTLHLNNVAQGNVINYSFDDLVDDIYYFFQKFPIYNTLINCQHFGSNLFNKWTGQENTFVSDDVMIKYNSNGTSTLPGLRFGFLPRTPEHHKDDKKPNGKK